jgi:carnitine 3-dehydrogenase
MSIIKKAAAIGGGVIGAGWVARLALNGIDVTIFDPDPEASRKVGEVMKGARRAYRAMLPNGLPREGRINYVKTIAEAVSGADFIQESVPERLDLKHRVLAEIDLHAAKDALIGSSTSGIKPTDMQSAMKRPQRLVVGHPFNPVYLLPLVEIVGGETTSKKFIERAREVYASIGMKPVVIRKEIEAFVGDRLLEAAWREALWLVKDGITTVEELDDIMRYSFGLRWAQMGMFQVYRIAGGEAGMRHFMAQFGPALKWPWTKLTDVPEFNDELVDLIANQSDEQAHGLSIRQLERIRDDNLVAIMDALSRQNKGKGWGAGALHNDYTRQLAKLAAKKPKASKSGAKAKAAKPVKNSKADKSKKKQGKKKG